MPGLKISFQLFKMYLCGERVNIIDLIENKKDKLNKITYLKTYLHYVFNRYLSTIINQGNDWLGGARIPLTKFSKYIFPMFISFKVPLTSLNVSNYCKEW